MSTESKEIVIKQSASSINATEKKKERHVFIDTNVYLISYDFSDDQPYRLKELMEHITNGDVKLYITQQVIDEFYRNRDSTLAPSLDVIKSFSVKTPRVPAFCANTQEIKEIRNLFEKLTSKSKDAYTKFSEDALNFNLEYDKLFLELITKVKVIPVSDEIIAKASKRIALGNPPGKNGSLGDAINWEILLENVPNNQNFFIITGDGDYISELGKNTVDSFLSNEWTNKKKSKLKLFSTISSFLMDELKDKKITPDEVKKEESNVEYNRLKLVQSYLDGRPSTALFASTPADRILRQIREAHMKPILPKWTDTAGIFGTNRDKYWFAGSTEVECSNCKTKFMKRPYETSTYCPNCGKFHSGFDSKAVANMWYPKTKTPSFLDHIPKK